MKNLLKFILVPLMFFAVSTVFANVNVKLAIHNNSGQSLFITYVSCDKLALTPVLKVGDQLPEGTTTLTGSTPGGDCFYSFDTDNNVDPKGRAIVDINAYLWGLKVGMNSWGTLSYEGQGGYYPDIDAEMTIDKK